MSDLIIRPASAADAEPIWGMLEPVIRAGETYALPRDMAREAALSYWLGGDRATYLAERAGEPAGTYYLRANQPGGGAHVANCGYVTALKARGQGIARGMFLHSLDVARGRGFRAMQFNFVVASNLTAIRLWQSLGFVTLCRLPSAFQHPQLGFVDALVMHRELH